MALILVYAVLSDIVSSRLAAAEAESTARQTGRSLLAGYEPALLAYGLFGADAGEDRRNGVVSAMLEMQTKETESQGKRLFTSQSDFGSLTVEPLYRLADHRVFQRQLLERMKYITAIQYGIEITQKIGKGKALIAQAEQYVKLSREMEAILKKREDALDEAWMMTQAVINGALTANSDLRLQPLVDQVVERLKRAEAANDELRKQLNAPAPKLPNKPDTVYPHVTVYPISFFSEYKTGMGAIASFHEAWVLEQSVMEPTDEQVQVNEERREQLLRYTAEWRGKKTPEETKRQEEGRLLRQQQADQKRAAEKELNRRRDNWKDACQLRDIQDYDLLTQAGGLYDKYKAYNEHITAGGMQPDIQTDNTEAFLFAAMQMTKLIAEAATELRNEAYMNEYALTHFTYRTYKKQNVTYSIRTNIGDARGHRLQEQEAEYILYGLPGCILNLSAAQTELFVLRTGVRTMETLMQPQTAAAAASPMLVLLKALAEGAKAANRDMDALLAGGSIDLPFVPGVTMNYKDHLRLFYLLHSRDASVMSRMQALIELNTGINILERYTAVRVQLSTNVDGWVLPAQWRQAEAVVSY
jgi:hypothetical protein